MTLNLEVLGATWDSGIVEWTSRDTLSYALSVGAGATDACRELQLTTLDTEGTQQVVLPTFLTTLTANDDAMPNLGDFYEEQVLHAEQTIEITSAIPAAGAAKITSSVTRILDKGTGSMIETEARFTDAQSGQDIGTTRRPASSRMRAALGANGAPQKPGRSLTGVRT